MSASFFIVTTSSTLSSLIVETLESFSDFVIAFDIARLPPPDVN